MNNYRPISVISIIAKVFERLVYDQLYSFRANEEIITNQQSGFRSLHSTVIALLEATDSWALDIDRGNVNAVVFLDLKKAFDTVDYDVVLRKLSLYGIQESAYDCLRTQECVANGSLSKVCSLGCGVPQGTILGPLLFFIYITDLPNCLSFCQPRMYADDTNITFASARDSTKKLNVPLPRTNYLKRSFSYRRATFCLRNSLPCNLRQEKSLNGLSNC